MARLDDVLNYDSKYIDENNILKNKINATTLIELEKQERIITNYKLAELYMRENNGNFDVQHYLNIHKFLFEDIYDFAGEIRSENIAKTIPFCLPNLIYSNLKNTLENAKRDSLRITNEEELIEFLADYYAQIDIIHPFREGNGRCEREFFRQYVLEINKKINFGEYELDYSNIDNKDNFIKAVIIADATCDLTLLKEYMRAILVKKRNLRK